MWRVEEKNINIKPTLRRWAVVATFKKKERKQMSIKLGLILYMKRLITNAYK